MFEEMLSSSPQILYIGTNILKGGDFMEKLIPVPEGTVLADPLVLDDRHDPKAPRVVGRTEEAVAPAFRGCNGISFT